MVNTKLLLKVIMLFGVIGPLMLSGCSKDDDDDDDSMNMAPTASAGDDQTVTELEPVSLNGTADDMDGSIASYQWTQISTGTEVSLTNADSASASFVAPLLEAEETISFLLTVTDNLGATGTSTTDVTIQVNASNVKYKVTVYNVTNGQPLTPVAAILHNSDFHAWNLAQSSSVGLEKLAESGDPSEFLSDGQANSNVFYADASAGGPFGPGASKSVLLSALPSNDINLTVATMLANTNDAFTGVKTWNLASLDVGDTGNTYTKVYDAGTELNTEAAGSIPGPADGGEGFNANRDDLIDAVLIHAGVVSNDDGLATSILTEAHRWNGPAARISVIRLN